MSFGPDIFEDNKPRPDFVDPRNRYPHLDHNIVNALRKVLKNQVAAAPEEEQEKPAPKAKFVFKGSTRNQNEVIYTFELTNPTYRTEIIQALKEKLNEEMGSPLVYMVIKMTSASRFEIRFSFDPPAKVVKQIEEQLNSIFDEQTHGKF